MSALLEFGPFEIDSQRRVLLRDGAPVALTPKAFDVLLLLVEHQPEIVSKEFLMESLWPGVAVQENNLNQCIANARRALGEKARENRYVITVPGQGYRFAAEVRTAANGVVPAASVPPGESVHRLWTRAGLAIAGISILLVVGLALAVSKGSFPAATVRPPIPPIVPGGRIVRLTNDPAFDGQPDWSPDGMHLVFVSTRSGKKSIWLMDADGANPRNLTPGLGRSDSPAWSPDGRRIAFQSDRGGISEIFVMDADGSNAHSLGVNGARANWSPDGSEIAFYGSFGSGKVKRIFAIHADGTHLRAFPYSADFVASPAWSPDGKRLLFDGGDGKYLHIWVMDADGRRQRQLTNGDWFDSLASWSPDGSKIAFVSDRGGHGQQLWVMSADGSHPVQLTDSAAHDSEPSWSPDGTRLAFESGRDGNMEIYVLNLNGEDWKPWTTGAGSDGHPSLSRDGRLVFHRSTGGKRNIFVADGAGAAPRNLTANPADDYQPAWSPDGTRIVFASDRGGSCALYVMAADGANVTRVAELQGDSPEPAWTPDGSGIVFSDSREGKMRLYTVGIAGGQPRPLGDGRSEGWSPSLSPDGKRIAFQGKPDGVHFEILVADAGGRNPRSLTKDDVSGNGHPAWSPDGKTILFSSGRAERSKIFAMNSDGGNPRVLTQNPAWEGEPVWSPDGKTFLFVSDRDGVSKIYSMPFPR